jgi:hypothetical protein
VHLPGLNADFDGDILNIIGLMLEELKYSFRKFDPVSRMIISRDTGLVNDYFAMTKDQLIGLNYFATVKSDTSRPEVKKIILPNSTKIERPKSKSQDLKSTTKLIKKKPSKKRADLTAEYVEPDMIKVPTGKDNN